MSVPPSAPRGSRVIAVYATLGLIVGVGLPLIVSAGNDLTSEPVIGGSYSVSKGSACVGQRFNLEQSGRFVNLVADTSTPSGSLDLDGGRLTGSVDCVAGSRERIDAKRNGQSLRGTIGGARLEANFVAALPATAAESPPPPANVAGDYALVPSSTCLGSALTLSGPDESLSVIAGKRRAGTLSYASGRYNGKVTCNSGKRVAVSGSSVGRDIDLTLGDQTVRAQKSREFGQTVAIFFIAVTVIMLVARAVGWLVMKAGFPRVMGEVLAGIMLGPTLLGAISPQLEADLFPSDIVPVLGVVANLGLIFYMFLVGLEFDPRLLKGRISQAAVISNASVALPLTLGFGLALFLYPRLGPDVDFLPFALFIGVAMSITAFPVLARILAERRMLGAPVGAISMAAAAVDDVTAWFLIALATAVAAASGASSVIQTIVLAIAFCVLMFFGVRPLLSRVSRAFEEAGRVPGGWVVAIFAGILLAAFTTEAIGIAVIFGAFVMGLVMPRNAGLTEDVTGRIEDFVIYLLLPIFFVYTGLRTNVGLLDRPELWAITGLILVVAIVGKFVGGLLSSRITGFDWRGAAVIGTLMNTRGLTELIVLNLALETGVITTALFSALVLMALITTFMAGPLLKLIDPSNRYGVPVDEELDAAKRESERDFPALPVPERSVLVAPLSDAGVAQLVAIVEPLARAEPRREVILARVIRPTSGAASGARGALQTQNRQLSERSERVLAARDSLVSRGVASRAATFISVNAGEDLNRLAEREDVDLLLTEGRRPLLGSALPRGEVGAVLQHAPCDVAVLVASEKAPPLDASGAGPVVVPFGGAEHDWAALELGAWIASATGRKLRLLGAAPDADQVSRLTRMLADAALLVQAYAGVSAESSVVERTREAIVGSAAGADLLVVGLSERWRREGLGEMRSDIARLATAPVLFVRRGARPGALAPQEDVTRFGWSTVGA